MSTLLSAPPCLTCGVPDCEGTHVVDHEADVQRARAEWRRNFQRRVDAMARLMRGCATDNTPTPRGKGDDE